MIIFNILTINSYQLNSHYYYGYNSNDDSNSNSNKKYVNSGQSITLVCDLPTNMPDGQV